MDQGESAKPRPARGSRGPDPAPASGSLPEGMVLAGAWAWRVLAILAVLGVFGWLVVQLRYIVIPFLIALLLAALLAPFSGFLQRHGWPKALAILTAFVGMLAVVAGLVVLVVWQVRIGLPALQTQSLRAFDEFKAFLLSTPFQITGQQVNDYVASLWSSIQRDGGSLLNGALSVGTTAGHIAAGVLLALFATLFLLIDGAKVWAWTVKVFPLRARAAVDGAGRAGWTTLTTFVKVQIFVAAVDAVGIGLGAVILQLPLAIPIAIAVFLGSFIPVVGAVLTGAIAIFVALVYHGPVVALVMLGVVLLVQQVEGHVLQPLVMGSAVRVHALAVVFGVAAGSLVAGIPGALFAVPIIAVFNVMVTYIANGAWREPASGTRKPTGSTRLAKTNGGTNG